MLWLLLLDIADDAAAVTTVVATVDIDVVVVAAADDIAAGMSNLSRGDAFHNWYRCIHPRLVA